MALRETQRLLDGHDAQDAAQEAIARAWRHTRACSSADPSGWVRTIARNEALRLIARRTEARGADGYDAFDPADLSRDVQRRLDVVAGMSRLSVRERQAVFLRYWTDKTDREIASLLETPIGTIKIRIHRAHKKLYAELGDEMCQ